MADHVALLREMYEAYNRLDFETVIAMSDPDAELIPPGGQAPIRGRDQIRRWLEPDAFVDQIVEAQEFIPAGDKVLVRHKTTARGASSGLPVDVSGWLLWTFNTDGKITRGEFFLSHEEAEARAALGV